MVGELGYRIKADGADETIQKLRALNEQIREGTISLKDARVEHRELTAAGRATSSQFGDIKGAIAAANPNLMEFTKTMSIFGGVANVAMSALNTINLAMLNGSSASQSLSQQYQKNADDYNAFIRLYESPNYGPGSPVTQAAYQKYQADLNSTSNLQKQLGVASLDTGISVTVSAIAMVGSMSQAYIALKAIQWDRAFAGLSGSIATLSSSAAGIAGIFIGIALAALAAGSFVGEAFNQNKDAVSDFRKQLDDSFGDNPFTNYIIFPIAAMIDDLNGAKADWGNDVNTMQNAWVGFANWVIGGVNDINTALRGLNIPGIGGANIPLMKTPAEQQQSAASDATNQFLLTGKIPSTASASSSSQSTEMANTIAQHLAQTKQTLESMLEPTKQTATNSIQSNAALAGIGGQLAQNNQSLTAINSGVAGLLQPLTNQEAATAQLKDSLNQTITGLQQHIADLESQPQTTQVLASSLMSSGAYNDRGQDWTDSLVTVASQSATDLAASKQQLATLQSQASGLDNYTSGLAPVLASIGLSGDSGIGSIISGALGGAAGIGGAGISAGELQDFAQTGDYGVFTKAAINDNTVKTPTRQDQINAWMQATGGSAADAAKALGYATGISGNSNYDPNSAFGGLPGQYGNPSTPGSVLGNFKGPTSGNSSGGINVTVNNNIAGSLLASQSLNDTIQTTVKNSLLGVGWG